MCSQLVCSQRALNVCNTRLIACVGLHTLSAHLQHCTIPRGCAELHHQDTESTCKPSRGSRARGNAAAASCTGAASTAAALLALLLLLLLHVLLLLPLPLLLAVGASCTLLLLALLLF